jgi:hypothetical protein
MSEVKPGKVVQRLVLVISGIGSFAIVGHLFVWKFSNAYFSALGFAWLGQQLTWVQRYDASSGVMEVVFIIFVLACVLGYIHGSQSGTAPELLSWRWITVLFVAFCVPLAGVIISELGKLWLAQLLAGCGSMMVAGTAGFVLGGTVRDFVSGQGVNLERLVGAALLTFFTVCWPPNVSGIVDARAVLYKNGDRLPIVEVFGPEAGEWRLLLFQENRCFLVRFGTNHEISSLRIVDSANVSIKATGRLYERRPH